MNADAPGILGALERAIAAAGDEVRASAPGQVVSLSVELAPGSLAQSGPLGGDCRWMTPSRDKVFYAEGSAFAGGRAELVHLCGESSPWRILGSPASKPLAFFALPPAQEVPVMSFHVPRVLLRHEAGRESAVLTAHLDGRNPAAIARDWLEAAASMLSCRPHKDAVILDASTVEPDKALWCERVHRTTCAITEGRFQKAVLARRVELGFSAPLHALDLADRLAAAGAGSNVFALPHGPGHVVAASPERLLVKQGEDVLSDALAGTARRSGAKDEDERAEAALLASPKEQREHQVVVDAIATALAEICERLERPAKPELLRLCHVTHLWTPLTGKLRQGVSLIDAVESLHPTPAVSGFPRLAALNWLKEIGERRNGLYSGIAGWIDRDGDGEAAVILRSAYVEGARATLWAGAGIMAESQPEAEWAETEMKLATMLGLFEAQ
ncbi:isochorismate synthase [Afifella pfennigii]|uniref:isochorismate synthase n=1 Tax=Afifella pfennigii TaxID=209897 RepID=UPI0012EC3569|nr:isochorismate synthase [Afifella pfennigii]